ncbi:hypothetical protein EVU91_13635 [Macrococcoides bohemicum]|uniref:hypothetical protein n=1 Tax=Macrococcoides bohemicum TaxID=1903056 RepID=UPI00105A7744|nr:hypothetical protein [Macrococcus bohemicus]TDL33181.1 hypothetical protein EVU91_13635 [Macrococcus bohemicus]
MRLLIPLILIAGIMPLIATNLPPQYDFLSPILWILSGVVFFIAAYIAYKRKKKYESNKNHI